MNRKLSIGIDLDPHVKSMLARSVKEWHHLPVRWHKEESYHIPLIALGWVDEDIIPELIEILRNFCEAQKSFDLDFTNITMIHKKSEGVRAPRTIRCLGHTNTSLQSLEQGLLKALSIPSKPKKAFAPHIPLGQIRQKNWQEQADMPILEKEFPLILDVMTITLFEEALDEKKRRIMPLDQFDLSA